MPLDGTLKPEVDVADTNENDLPSMFSMEKLTAVFVLVGVFFAHADAAVVAGAVEAAVLVAVREGGQHLRVLLVGLHVALGAQQPPLCALPDAMDSMATL